MARRRKQKSQSTTEPVGRGARAHGGPGDTSSEPDHARRAPRSSQPFAANPPRRHLAFLVASAVALAVWLAFLLYLAWRG
jgi:hypothetical protein